jgi:hypothetical protein
MHTHACPLYALSKLMGLEFTESGIVLAPKIPLESFRFESSLLGVVKSERGYEGWYDPGKRDSYSVRFKLSPEDAKRISRVEVNGKTVEPRVENDALEMRGNGGGGTPLRWSVFR